MFEETLLCQNVRRFEERRKINSKKSFKAAEIIFLILIQSKILRSTNQ